MISMLLIKAHLIAWLHELQDLGKAEPSDTYHAGHYFFAMRRG
jgi:hypothetical protein